MNDSGQAQQGFTVVEMLVGVTLTLMIMGGLLGMLVESARINKSQQMTVEVQANARNSLALVTRQLRTAGYDPMNIGIPTVVLDPDPDDAVSQIEIFADLDASGDTEGPLNGDEQVTIRHTGDRIVLRETSSDQEAFKPIAINISNDADGDGVPEPMFVHDATPPTQITVQITAQSPVHDPVTKDFIRHTVSSVVVLRNTL
ncbi:MAG: hypothetical protein GY716_15045 [bacterium]|nr:hypothetical protein [bacterium]